MKNKKILIWLGIGLLSAGLSGLIIQQVIKSAVPTFPKTVEKKAKTLEEDRQAKEQIENEVKKARYLLDNASSEVTKALEKTSEGNQVIRELKKMLAINPTLEEVKEAIKNYEHLYKKEETKILEERKEKERELKEKADKLEALKKRVKENFEKSAFGKTQEENGLAITPLKMEMVEKDRLGKTVRYGEVFYAIKVQLENKTDEEIVVTPTRFLVKRESGYKTWETPYTEVRPFNFNQFTSPIRLKAKEKATTHLVYTSISPKISKGYSFNQLAYTANDETNQNSEDFLIQMHFQLK